MQGILPPVCPEAARVLSLALGFSLVWLWRGLRRRKRRAWQLAVAVVLASAAAHLAKGLDFEEASVSIVVLVALWHWRREFTAPGDPESIRPLLRNVAALGVCVFAVRAFDGHDRLGDALAVLGCALLARVIYLWLRPLAGLVASHRRRASAGRAAREEHGTDSLAYFKLRRDKSWFFSPRGHAFLGYRVEGGTAVISGDPVGPAEDVPALLGRSARSPRAGLAHRRARGERASPCSGCAMKVSVALHRRRSDREADTFSLEGRAIRKVRQSVTRLERAGYTVRLLRAGAADERLRHEVARGSGDWLGRQPERGFAMAMDTVFGYPDSMLAVAEDAEGGSAATSTGFPLLRAAAGRSRRCGVARTRRTA